MVTTLTFQKISILSWIKFRMAENQIRGHLTLLSIQIEVNQFFCANRPNQQSLEHLPFNLFCKSNLQWESKKIETKKYTNRHNKNRINFSSFIRFICYYFCVGLIPSCKKIVQVPNKDLNLLLNSNAKIMLSFMYE